MIHSPRSTDRVKMNVAVVFLLVCVAIPHALAGFGFFQDLPSLAESGKIIGSELVDQVEKHVGKAQKMVEGHRERMMEYKKQAKQLWNEHKKKLAARTDEAKQMWKEHKKNLLQKNVELMKQWREKEGLWRTKAEETWTEFRSRVELSLEKVKESIAGIEESLETNLPESPRELMKALKMRLKSLTLLLKDLYKSRFEEEVTEIQPAIPEEEMMTTPSEPEVEPEMYTTDLPPEELEPTENTKTPTTEVFTEIPKEEGKDWWEGPEGDGMIGDEESRLEIPEKEDDEDDSLEEETPSEEEDKDDDEGEDEESESDEDESESEEHSPIDFKRRKTHARHMMRELMRKYWAKRTRENESSEP